MSDTVQNEMEVIQFTQAEIAMLNQRLAMHRQSTAALNEWMAFLQAQYNVKEEDGWQLGDKGFERPKDMQQQQAGQSMQQPWREPEIVPGPQGAPAMNAMMQQAGRNNGGL